MDTIEMQNSESLKLDVIQSGSTNGREWSVSRGRFNEGLSTGVEVVVIRQGEFSFSVLPTRGMGIWYAQLGDHRIGWNSPIKNVVHPAFVNLQSRNGLGWLDGFNELICRCGLSFNGPPGRDESAGSAIESDLTLHGKIANLAAHSIEMINEKGTIGVSGTVDEATLFGPQLRLQSSIKTRIGENSFTIHDRIQNLGSSSTELELLYHTNFGTPLLQEGARMSLPALRVVPRDMHAANDVDNYQAYLPPTNGYTEQCYFVETLADEQGRTVVLLENPDGQRGVSLEYRKDQLPCFTQWKCTQSLQDGYVTGLEPGTNYPNFKSFERRQGRVVQLEAGASYEIELTLAVHSKSEDVSAVRERIATIQSQAASEICTQPIAPYCSSE